jgi:hypothetical protein
MWGGLSWGSQGVARLVWTDDKLRPVTFNRAGGKPDEFPVGRGGETPGADHAGAVLHSGAHYIDTAVGLRISGVIASLSRWSCLSFLVMLSQVHTSPTLNTGKNPTSINDSIMKINEL